MVYALRNTDTLAKNVLEAIGSEGQIMRKYYQRRLPEDPSKDYYFIMRETGNITPLLIEYGFIDNAADLAKLQNNLTDYAEAVVRAVSQYTGYPYVSPGGTSQNTYTVVKGDSLYSIAKKFNTTVDKLKTLNNLTSNNLSIGQTLKLPTTGGNAGSGYINYTVKSGDSLYKIAQTYDTTVKELIDFNNLTSTTLSIGQILKIPTENGMVEEPNYYTVARGDSLYSIARQLGVTVDDLMRANNLTSTVLQIGDKLIIPNNSSYVPPTQNENYLNYTVVRGDSLYSIANKYGTSVDTIKNLNNLTSNTLQIGQILKIPTTSTTNKTYTVVSGDSLYSIANKFNTTVDQLKILNNLTNNNLSIGQILQIP